MARKTALGKLNKELEKVRKEMQKHTDILANLKEQEASVVEQIEEERLKELKVMIDASGLSLEEVGQILSNKISE